MRSTRLFFFFSLPALPRAHSLPFDLRCKTNGGRVTLLPARSALSRVRLAHRRRLYVARSLVEDGIVPIVPIDILEFFLFFFFVCVSSSRSPPLRISWLRLNPRFALELHTIRGMVWEADDMDRGLEAALQMTQDDLC